MMETLIGSVLTTQKHSGVFYEHELARHSLITAVHQLRRVGFLSILQKIDRNELPGWDSDKCDTWEDARRKISLPLGQGQRATYVKEFEQGVKNLKLWRNIT